jgi:hypothetical protein
MRVTIGVSATADSLHVLRSITVTPGVRNVDGHNLGAGIVEADAADWATIERLKSVPGVDWVELEGSDKPLMGVKNGT